MHSFEQRTLAKKKISGTSREQNLLSCGLGRKPLRYSNLCIRPNYELGFEELNLQKLNPMDSEKMPVSTLRFILEPTEHR